MVDLTNFNIEQHFDMNTFMFLTLPSFPLTLFDKRIAFKIFFPPKPSFYSFETQD